MRDERWSWLGQWAILSSLEYRDYRLLFGSTSFAGLAMWTLMVGRGWLAYELSSSSTWVGIVTFAGFLPFILAPYGGVLADRFDRRLMAALSTGVSLVLTTVLAALTIAGVLQIVHLALITFGMSIPRAAELPARQSLIANVVPPSHLLNALSLSSVATFGTRAAGPALVIPLIETVQPGVIFLFAAGFYALSTLQVIQIHTVSRGDAQGGLGALKDLREGVDYILRTPPVAVLMLVVMLHCSLTMAFDSLLPVFAVRQLEGGGASFSALAMGVGAGALVGTLAISGLRDDGQKGRLLLLTGVLSGLTPMAMALPMQLMSLPAAVGSTAAMGATQGAFMALSGAMIQEVAPDKLRGRVSSIYLFVAGGLMAWVNLLNGALADVWHVPTLFLAPASLYLAVLVIMMSFGARLRLIFQRGRWRWPPRALRQLRQGVPD